MLGDAGALFWVGVSRVCWFGGGGMEVLVGGILAEVAVGL